MCCVFMSFPRTVWIIFFLAFVVVGPLVYFFGITQIQWAFFIAALLLFIRAFSQRNFLRLFLDTDYHLPIFFWLYILFFLSAAIGTFIDSPNVGEIIMSSRWYFFTFLMMVLIVFYSIEPHLIDQLWRLLLFLALLQLPVTFLQYLFFALPSERPNPWDAVVGTFPGRLDGGGQSAAMGMFVAFMMLMAYALWRKGALSTSRFLIQVLCGVATLALAEVKAVVLLLPLLLLAFFGRGVFIRPKETLAWTLGAVCVSAILLSCYSFIHYGHTDKAFISSKQTVYERILQAADPENESRVSVNMGRVRHLVFWIEENLASGDFQYALLGYGVGATQVSGLGRGEIASSYPYSMDKSTSMILLWETGLLGHLLFVLVLLAAAKSSFDLSRHAAIPDRDRAFLRVGGVIVLLLVITMPYKNFVMRSVPIQLLLVLCLWQILYWYTKVTDSIRSKSS